MTTFYDVPANFLIPALAERLTGHDAGVSGQKALESLKKGDLRDAEDHLYFSQYVEKPFAEFSKTWVKVYEAAKAQMLEDQ